MYAPLSCRRRSRRLRARSSSRSWRLPSHASGSHAASCSRSALDAPRKLTLIRAPAGWGKSTLLADWHALESETRPFAWVALDGGDNDPVRFWTYLIHALRTLDPRAGEVSLPMLRAPRASVVDDVLPALCNELTALPHQVVLVLDDYHLVRNPEIDEGLSFLLEHLPQTLELVLSSRSEPALPLARLRARGELAEIDAQQLRFSEEEADLFLNDLHGLGLDRADVIRLRELTEGWAAGLYLATLTIRGRESAHEFIEAFAGDNRHVVDYLSSEVLAGLPEEMRGFLLHTSVLERLCAPLCDAVTDRPGSVLTLHELERSNFFLIPLDTKREWYCYHHLFRELLRHELALAEPEHARTLHRRASAWHREHGDPSEAIHHATAAGDVADASELILRHWIEFRNEARLETLLTWLDGLPPETVHRRCPAVPREGIDAARGRPDRRGRSVAGNGRTGRGRWLTPGRPGLGRVRRGRVPGNQSVLPRGREWDSRDGTTRPRARGSRLRLLAERSPHHLRRLSLPRRERPDRVGPTRRSGDVERAVRPLPRADPRSRLVRRRPCRDR